MNRGQSESCVDLNHVLEHCKAITVNRGQSESCVDLDHVLEHCKAITVNRGQSESCVDLDHVLEHCKAITVNRGQSESCVNLADQQLTQISTSHALLPNLNKRPLLHGAETDTNQYWILDNE